MKALKFVELDSIDEDPEAHAIFVDFMDRAKEVYAKLQKMKIKKEEARYVLPNAVENQLVASVNFREWR